MTTSPHLLPWRLRELVVAAGRFLLGGLRAAGAAAAPAYASARWSLLVCPACGHDHVCPMDWDAAEAGWRVTLRCADCDTWWRTDIDDAEAEAMHAELERHVATIARALARMDAERMARDAEVLAAALRRDLIDASSFGA